MNEWVKIERKRRRIEIKYEVQWQYLFRNQLESYQKALDRNLFDAVSGIDRYFDKGVKMVYDEMVTETANKFKGDFLVKQEVRSAWETLVMNYLQKVGGDRITEIIAFTKKYVLQRLRPILNQGVEKGDGIAVIARRIINDIDEYKIGFSRYRAERIARTEIVGVSNWASMSSAMSSGVQDRLRKKWLCRVDGRERETHREMNAKPGIGMNDFFLVRNTFGGYDEMQYPGDPNGSSGNVINCRCAIIYERID